MAKHNRIGDTLRGSYVHGTSSTLLAVTERAPESRRRRLQDTLRVNQDDYRRMIEHQLFLEELNRDIAEADTKLEGVQ